MYNTTDLDPQIASKHPVHSVHSSTSMYIHRCYPTLLYLARLLPRLPPLQPRQQPRLPPYCGSGLAATPPSSSRHETRAQTSTGDSCILNQSWRQIEGKGGKLPFIISRVQSKSCHAELSIHQTTDFLPASPSSHLTLVPGGDIVLSHYSSRIHSLSPEYIWICTHSHITTFTLITL